MAASRFMNPNNKKSIIPNAFFTHLHHQIFCRYLTLRAASFASPLSANLNPCKSDPETNYFVSRPFQSQTQNVVSSSASASHQSTNEEFWTLVSQTIELVVEKGCTFNPSLKNLARRLRTAHVERILGMLDDPRNALEFFRFMKGIPCFKHSIACHGILMTKLLKAGIVFQAKIIRISTIKSCADAAEMEMVMELLGRLQKDEAFMIDAHAYNALLNGFAKFEMFDAMDTMVKDMEKTGVMPPFSTFNSMINALCKQGKVIKGYEYLSRMLHAGFNPVTFTYTSLILGHCRNRDLDEAFKVFSKMQNEGCSPDSATYSVLINGLCNEERVEEAFALFADMKNNGVEPTVHTYTVPLSVLCNKGRVDDAFDLFKDMVERGCRPNIYSYTVMISGLCKEGRLEEASAQFNEALKQGLIPNTVTYNALIDGLCQENKLDSAFQLIIQMQEANCKLNVRTYNELLKGLCRGNKMQKAMVLFHFMLQNGMTPTEVTFNTLISGYIKASHMKNAFRVFEWMKRNGCKPDAYTYTALIKGLCMEGKLNEALEMFSMMPEKGVSPTVVTYSILIDEACKQGKIDDAFRLLDHMNNNGCRKNVQTYNALINGLCKQTRMQEAKDIIKRMEMEGIDPNIVTYTILVDGYCRESSVDKAYELVNSMPQKGLEPNVHTYGALVDGLCRAGRIQDAVSLLDEVESKGLKPIDVLCRILIQNNIKLNRLDHAFYMVQRMVKNNCQLDFQVLPVLLQGLFEEIKSTSKIDADNADTAESPFDLHVILKLVDRIEEINVHHTVDTFSKLLSLLNNVGRLLEADQLFKNMLYRGLYPDETIFSSMVSVYCKMGVSRNALGHLGLMVKQALEPSLNIYKTLIVGLYREGKIEEANMLFQNLVRGSFSPDEIVWTIIIDGLAEIATFDGLCKLLHLMEDKGCKPYVAAYDVLIKELYKADSTFESKAVEEKMFEHGFNLKEIVSA